MLTSKASFWNNNH